MFCVNRVKIYNVCPGELTNQVQLLTFLPFRQFLQQQCVDVQGESIKFMYIYYSLLKHTIIYFSASNTSVWSFILDHCIKTFTFVTDLLKICVSLCCIQDKDTMKCLSNNS